MKTPIIINNRNLLTWPSKMVEDCQKFDDVGDIIIVDNGSTYEPLLEWYKTNPCEIIYTENYGQSCPWIIGLPQKIGSEFYVVTDPDLDLSQTPKDCLNFIKEKLLKYDDYSKIGLSLYNWEVPENSPYHHFLKTWSIVNWDSNSVVDGLLTSQPIDTTFGMYNINKGPNSGKNCTTYLPYSARHIPWELTNDVIRDMKNKNYEYYYYLSHATSASSIKNYIGFKNNYE
jgi:glycosyltransferase involved in cell wall biosynthesis